MEIKTSGQTIRSPQRSSGQGPVTPWARCPVAVNGDDAVSVIALYPESGADEVLNRPKRR